MNGSKPRTVLIQLWTEWNFTNLFTSSPLTIEKHSVVTGPVSRAVSRCWCWVSCRKLFCRRYKLCSLFPWYYHVLVEQTDIERHRVMSGLWKNALISHACLQCTTRDITLDSKRPETNPTRTVKNGAPSTRHLVTLSLQQQKASNCIHSIAAVQFVEVVGGALTTSLSQARTCGGAQTKRYRGPLRKRSSDLLIERDEKTAAKSRNACGTLVVRKSSGQFWRILSFYCKNYQKQLQIE